MKFLKECAYSFQEIRDKYQLDEDTLKVAKLNPMLEKMAEIVLDGCTDQGVMKIAKGMPAWKFRNRGGNIPIFPLGIITGVPIPYSQCDPTDNMVSTVSEHYEGTCRALRRQIDELEP